MLLFKQLYNHRKIQKAKKLNACALLEQFAFCLQLVFTMLVTSSAVIDFDKESFTQNFDRPLISISLGDFWLHCLCTAFGQTMASAVRAYQKSTLQTMKFLTLTVNRDECSKEKPPNLLNIVGIQNYLQGSRFTKMRARFSQNCKSACKTVSAKPVK